MTRMTPTRRTVLKAGVGVTALSGLSGCMDFLGRRSGSDADGYAAFFSPYDFARQIGGESLVFENPVGIGRMGHGWNPPSDLTPNIAGTDMFIYLDTPEFSWAQDVARTLERDHADDVRIIDLLAGLEPYFIPFDYDADDRETMPTAPSGHAPPVDEVGFEEFDLWDLRSHEQLGYWHVDHYHGGVPAIPLDGSVPVGIVLRDVRETPIALGGDEAYRVDARIVDGDADAVDIHVDENVVEFHGMALGESRIVFEFYRNSELVYDTTAEPTSVTVVEEVDGGDGFHDPHTWVDPIIVQEMVDRLADEFAEHDPENAETYRVNAEAYSQRIADVDRQFQELVDTATLDVAVFAGHDSFQYIERRYGFDLRTPTGVSPDADVSFSDIRGLIETIEANDIDVVLFDPFEAPEREYPRMVETIFENSDVDDAKPLTAVEGSTAQWDENDWGWVEQMERVNLPNLEAALNPG